MDSLELFFNLLTTLIFPLLLKILNDIGKLSIKIAKCEEDIKELKEDVQKLEGCLYELKKTIYRGH